MIDTNVFVSSFFGGNPRKIIGLWKEERLTLCLSNDILDEYILVLQKLGLKNQRELQEILSLFATRFSIDFTGRTPQIRAVKGDSADDKFIECAVALKADVIITGDRALKAIGDYAGIPILTPQEFLKGKFGRTLS